MYARVQYCTPPGVHKFGEISGRTAQKQTNPLTHNTKKLASQAEGRGFESRLSLH